MEIGETGEHGQAAVGAVVVVAKLVLDNAITLLRKTVEEIAVAAIKKGRLATHTLVRVITMANCYFTIYSQMKNHFLCYCCETYIDIKFVFKGSHMCD